MVEIGRKPVYRRAYLPFWQYSRTGLDSSEQVIFLTIETPPPASSDIILKDLGTFINFSTSPTKSTWGGVSKSLILVKIKSFNTGNSSKQSGLKIMYR